MIMIKSRCLTILYHYLFFQYYRAGVDPKELKTQLKFLSVGGFTCRVQSTLQNAKLELSRQFGDCPSEIF